MSETPGDDAVKRAHETCQQNMEIPLGEHCCRCAWPEHRDRSGASHPHVEWKGHAAIDAAVKAARLESLTATRSRMAVAKYGTSVKVTRDMTVTQEKMHLADDWGNAIEKRLLDVIDSDIVDARAAVEKVEQAAT